MKKIEIKNENIVMNLLKKGFKVEGRLWLEETEDGKFIIRFDRYNRKPQPKQRNWLIRRLEHGWVKESVERIKVYESIPKEIGTPRILAVIDRETKEAKNAMRTPSILLTFKRCKLWDSVIRRISLILRCPLTKRNSLRSSGPRSGTRRLTSFVKRAIRS